MTKGIDGLPADIPLFPLPQVILLPRVTLPLNVFEPRYVAMVDYALQHDRLIGIVQYRPDTDGALYPVGCVGKIIAFNETEDGRYLVTLRGICRFRLAGETVLHADGFRMARPAWDDFAGDFIPDTMTDVCRDAMQQTLRRYFDKKQIVCDQWRKIHEAGCESLISTLSVICPLGIAEKQALLEATTLSERARLLQAFLAHEAGIDCGCNDNDGTTRPCH